MRDLPFSIYDFFAYLASGCVLVWFIGRAFDITWFSLADPPVLVVLQWIIAAYIAGHVVAHLSSAVIEGIVVRRWLRRTEHTLFDDAPRKLSWCFPGFFRSLPRGVRDRVLARAAAAGITMPGESLFYHCFAIAKQDATAFGRMNTFLNLYGFARNICMACLLGAVALTLGALQPYLHGGAPSYEKQLLVLPSTFVAIVMFYRYLKFYRLYSLEMYVTYAAQE